MKKLIATTSIVAALLAAGSVQAQESQAPLQVMSAANGKMRAAVLEFKRGNYEKAVMFNQYALKDGINRNRKAIVYSNLCATYYAMGDYTKAQNSCRAALELRPQYSPALANTKVVQVKLAQN